MDLCCLIESKGPLPQAADLVSMLGDLLERGSLFAFCGCSIAEGLY
jgi:hypothetical protein